MDAAASTRGVAAAAALHHASAAGGSAGASASGVAHDSTRASGLLRGHDDRHHASRASHANTFAHSIASSSGITDRDGGSEFGRPGSSPSSSPPPSPSSAAGASRVDDFEASENLVAGGIAGLVAETIMHPFDTVSHRAKVHPSSAYGTWYADACPRARARASQHTCCR